MERRVTWSADNQHYVITELLVGTAYAATVTDSPAPTDPSAPSADPVARLLLADGHRLAPEAQTVTLLDLPDDADAPAASLWPRVRSHRDRLDTGPSTDTLAEAVQGAELVLLHLPTSLAALQEQVATIAAHAAPQAVLVAAGRVKHMTPSQNTVLARAFTEVQPQRGVGKCRALHAAGLRSDAPSPEPRSAIEPTTGLTLVAHGPVFAGPRLDRGTSLLLKALSAQADRALTGLDALDLGCGNGILTAVLARSGAHVTGLDVSRAAVASTRATLAANDLPGIVVLTDGLTEQDAASADLIVTNPPFHVGAAKDSTPTLGMLRDARRVLRPEGELWCVFNSHLPYLRTTREVFSQVTVVDRDREFTVLRARG